MTAIISWRKPIRKREFEAVLTGRDTEIGIKS